jgi:hypothetical protein
MSEVSCSSTQDLLNILPEDEFKLVLGYLPFQAKANLKQTSKTNEKRVMCFEPGLKNWTVVINEKNWAVQGLTLANARIRHIVNGTIQDINLTVRFKNEVKFADTFYSILFLMSNILNTWNDNIIHLDFKISGYENFLLDPGLNLPHLKSLKVTGSKPSVLGQGWDIDDIISAVLDRQSDTLEKLELRDLYITLTAPSTLKLQLREFVAHSLSYRVIIELMKSSQLSLENLEVCNLDEIYGEEEIDMMQALKLNIKQFKAVCTNAHFVSIVIKSAKSTLRQLDLARINLEGALELGETELKLTSLSASIMPLEILTALAKASKSSLEELDLKILSFDGASTDTFFKVISQLELTSLSTGFISTEFLSSLLQSTKPSLKELTLGCIEDDEDQDDLHIGRINRMELKHLKKFTSVNNSTRLTSAIINSSHATLQSLKMSSFISDSIDHYELFQLQQDKLHLKKLVCNDIPTSITCKIINSCQPSLEHLEVHRDERSELEDTSYDLAPAKMNLIEFSCSEIDFGFVSEIMKLSHSTLEHLCLRDIGCGNCIGKFGLHSMPLKLKSFDGKCIDIEIVTAILKSSTSWFNAIKLREIKQYIERDIQLDIQLKNSMMFDPELAKLLLHVKFQNPYCVIDI